MVTVYRDRENPILVGESHNSWEAQGAFNGCPIKNKGNVHIFYRAQSSPILHNGVVMEVSSIGQASSKDGIHFGEHHQFIFPEFSWEQFGCEDPRITKLDDKFYIFYTALSDFPFSSKSINVGLAITKDLKKIEKKHRITPFNAKAMALFPERINGKIYAVLTANTDIPPAKISIAKFDCEEDLWSEKYWENWYTSLDEHVISLQRNINDQVELGAPPLKTKKGWLLIYSYIRNYLGTQKIFGIEAVLLDLKNPQKILGRTELPLMVPEEEYELYGKVPNIIFPSGVLVKNKKLIIYYGAADTTCCVAECDLDALIKEVLEEKKGHLSCKRLENNPLLEPIAKNAWEAKAVFNPTAIREKGITYIFYRAMSKDDTSVIGYAWTKDGMHIDGKADEPVYVPREKFEMKLQPGNSGCEDPRMTKIGENIFMCYTAVDAKNAPRVALTSIKVSDLISRNWNWVSPKLISPPGIDDKDACVLPEKVRGKYVFFHRIQPSIDINFFDSLNFEDGRLLEQNPIMLPRKGMWDNKKIGLNTVLKTKFGWLMIYHGVSEENSSYRIGAALLELHNPEKVIARTKYPILEPQMAYEKEGIVPNVVFPCGAIKMGTKLYIYYGGGDRVIGGATIEMAKVLKMLTE
jgi:predicted GH43/DUF377 family glycosyl hydrolase